MRKLVFLFLLNLVFGCNISNKKTNINELSLGLSFSNEKIFSSVFSIDADSIKINIYKDCDATVPLFSIPLFNEASDMWKIELPDSLINYCYSFTIFRKGIASKNVVDPYVKAVCANGNRGSFVNVTKTSPLGWNDDTFLNRKDGNPIVLYELHIRDFSIDSSSGMEHRGKYLAFTENNTKGLYNQATGLDHIESLGITHIHLLPVFDFASIDELSNEPNYNWGYDPQNYFVPEGSYSTKPNEPENRILEFKSMVQSIHKRGLGVIMDVVYNHTYYLDKSSFQEWAPSYYYRQNDDGSYSNASGCGNEIATEKPFVRKMIIESLKFWMREYHIDGFRFDLMGIMDIPTMREIEKELQSINPSVVLYGEGWLAGSSPLPDSLRAVKANMKMLTKTAAFSDEIRDGIKGHWSNEKDKGFVSGKPGLIPSVEFGIVGAVEHPQIDYRLVNNSNIPWAVKPAQCINYVSCHDNHTLIDKLEISCPEYSEELRREMHLLAQSIVLTSQGIPFLHAGTEFFRTKKGDHNSFESPDSINLIDWNLANQYKNEIQYFRDLIEFKKTNPSFWLKSKEAVRQRIKFYDSDRILSYSLNAENTQSEFKEALFIFVPVEIDSTISLPEGNWKVRFDKFLKVESDIFKSGNLKVVGPQAVILTR
jgi:pullulanase